MEHTHTHASVPSRGPSSLNNVPPADILDPVCGMRVDPETAPASFDHGGKTYYFCNPSCAEKFAANPGHFLQTVPSVHHMGSSAPPPGAKVEYTCPMHPEVVSDHPGSCPKCGMALEPRNLSLEEGPNPEWADMTRRLAVGVLLGLPLVLFHL